MSDYSNAAQRIMVRLAEASHLGGGRITVRRERDDAGHCYYVFQGGRKIAGPFPDTAAGKAAAEARAGRERERRRG